MNDDLYENERAVYDRAASIIEEVSKGASFDFQEYEALVKEYGRLLKLVRQTTRWADRQQNRFFGQNLDLADKVKYDALTGIYNRRYLEEQMILIISTLSRTNNCRLSVLMMDVDNFKKYNDTYGHAMGDACLKAVAETLKASVTRTVDFAARYGGEEFTVVLPNTGEAGARKIADTILENVRALNIPHEKNEPGIVTISIGITTGTIEHAQCGGDYIKRADEALYASKNSGRNQYTYINLKEEEDV